MASESYSVSQSLLTTEDDFEGLGAAEFDPNMLQELLYEPGEEVEGEAFLQSTEVAEANRIPAVETNWCLNDTNDDVQSFDWLDMVEETSAPCNDLEAWYWGECMEEINGTFDIGEHSLSNSAIMSEEIGYIGLWQEN
ncbi:hypothetical protein CDL12_15878 [Handroanthus impetiginosus]|uniref:Uncharacterized protein n=1 Tax=Handroanthus impetiginosus TaxID=429701 RepID=A0A2G9H1V3_9LAMI|nr:hypothetical protein CDL12_15878 [Handroanthus impetiginosus]